MDRASVPTKADTPDERRVKLEKLAVDAAALIYKYPNYDVILHNIMKFAEQCMPP